MVVCVNCDTWLLSGVCILPKVKLAVPAGLIVFASVLPLMEGSRSSGLAWLLLAGLWLSGCCLLICCWSAYNDRRKSCMHNITLHSYLDYFMGSARILYSCMSCWRIRKQTSECSAQVSFLIQKWVHKDCTKHFPCFNLFILYMYMYLLRLSPSTFSKNLILVFSFSRTISLVKFCCSSTLSLSSKAH